MDLYSRIVEGVYACAGRLTANNAWQIFCEIQKAEIRSLAEIESLQWNRVKAHISFAYEHVEMYRSLWKALDIHPEDISSRNDLMNIPVVSKQTLVEQPMEKKLAYGNLSSGLVPVHTSGTTGQPLQVFMDSEGYNQQYANLLYGYYLTGWRLGKKMITVRNYSHGDYENRYSPSGLAHEPFPLLRKLVYRLFHRKRFLPPLQKGMQPDEKMLEDAVREIQQTAPYFLEGNGYFWYLLARYVKENGIKIPSVGAAEIDEVPLAASQKKVIEEAFNCKTYDVYGSHELGVVAHECSAGMGNHILSLSYNVEILEEHSDKEVAPGSIGRVVVTDLTNRVTPLIRYDTGDLATRISKPCSCGRAFPLMGHIEGRMINSVMINGTRYTERFFQDIIFGFEDVIGFQINREDEGSDNIKVSLLTRSDGLKEKVAEALKNAVGCSVKVETVNNIDLEKSGKARWVKL